MPKQTRQSQNYDQVNFPEVQNKHHVTQASEKNYSLKDVSWYHGDISRNVAEAILLSNGQDGTYLLRSSKNHPGYSVSVRCHSAIKHYQIAHDKTKEIYIFGSATFYSLQELLNHFESIPVISSDGSDIPVILKHPYRNDIREPGGYVDIRAQGEIGKGVLPEEKKPNFDMSSKEGFLTKRGAIHKSWKERWFVVLRNELKYYDNRKNNRPIKVLDLKEAVSVSEDCIDGKKDCFNLVFPNRTFYFVAKSPQEVHQWITFLQWKIDHYKSQD